MRPISCHAIHTRYGTKGHHALVGTFVAHYAHRLNRKQHGSGLPNLIVKTISTETFDEQKVHFLQNSDLFGGHITQNTNAQAGAGERMTTQQRLGQAQRPANRPNLVFEKRIERLHHVQFHEIGQAPHVVVRFDGGRWAFYGYRFDYVGINSALTEPGNVFEQVCFVVEHVDERLANGFTLGFGIGETRECRVKQVFGINSLDVQAEGVIALQYLLELAFAKQAIIHKNTVQILPNGPVNERCRYRRIDSPGKSHHDLIITQFGSEIGNGGIHK